MESEWAMPAFLIPPQRDYPQMYRRQKHAARTADRARQLVDLLLHEMYEGDNFDVGKLRISDLSGGQKVKMVFCGIQIKNPHIILFDEPTNHLDIISIGWLEDFLEKFY